MTLSKIPGTVEEAHAVLDEILSAAVDDGRVAYTEYQSLCEYVNRVIYSFAGERIGLEGD